MVELTVLMPVYNAEKYLDEAIDSILNQTFTNFELLIIDDGSTDNSIEIISSYQDSRIRLVKNEQNIGISRTLNKGIELASSEIIARMDADDISLPERLQKQYEYLMNHPECGLVSSNAKLIKENGEVHEDFNPKHKPQHELFYYNLIFNNWIFHPAVMYRKEEVQDVGMYPDTYGEDFCLWSKFIRKYRFYVMQEILIKYRITTQSVSNSLYKDEYGDAVKNQVIDNLKYFAGSDYSISHKWIDAYCNNIAPLCKPPKIAEIAGCIREVDRLTPYIIAKENVNHRSADIERAAEIKQQRLIEAFLKRLSSYHKIQLLILIGQYKRVAKYISVGILKKILNK